MKRSALNAERLLALYERVADAPDAIARLRRFVLDLAVRGKLVEQDPHDEPASGLLRRIADGKAASGKRQKELPAIDPESFPGIPKNWCRAPLIALGGWAIGSGFPKNEQGQTEGPYFFLKVSDMNLPENDKYITTANNFIDDDAAKRMRATIHPPGTIIFPKIGGAISTNKRRILTRGSAIDNNCLGLTFSPHVDTEWAYLLMTSLDFTLYQAGTAVPALQQGTLAAITVALPPLAEQRRIVAKVEELMALLDRLETTRTTAEAARDRLTAASLTRLTALDNTPETFPAHARFALDALPALTARSDQIKALRQTILNLAVRGKLVEQDPNDEPASELLKRIAAEKARLVKAGEVRKQKPSAPIMVDDERFFTVPSGWVWVRLIEVGVTQTGTSPSSSKPELVGDFIPFVKPADLDGATILYDGSGLSREGKGCSRVAPPNSVMMVCIGATLGKVNVNDREVCFNQQINSLTPYVDGLHRFLALALKSSDFQERAWARAGTGTLPIISKGKWEVLPIPLPPLAEQHRIMAKVDAVMALCDRLEAALATADTTKQRLLESLLHEALAPAATAREIEVA